MKRFWWKEVWKDLKMELDSHGGLYLYADAVQYLEIWGTGFARRRTFVPGI